MSRPPSRQKRGAPPARAAGLAVRPKPAPVADDYSEVHGAIVALLEASRRAAARNVNALMSASYWAIGRRIVESEQGGAARAGYGAALLKRLSIDLSARFGRGFSERNLEQMRLFYLGWPGISQTVSAKSLANQPASKIAQTLSAQSSAEQVTLGLSQIGWLIKYGAGEAIVFDPRRDIEKYLSFGNIDRPGLLRRVSR